MIADLKETSANIQSQFTRNRNDPIIPIPGETEKIIVEKLAVFKFEIDIVFVQDNDDSTNHVDFSNDLYKVAAYLDPRVATHPSIEPKYMARTLIDFATDCTSTIGYSLFLRNASLSCLTKLLKKIYLDVCRLL